MDTKKSPLSLVHTCGEFLISEEKGSGKIIITQSSLLRERRYKFQNNGAEKSSLIEPSLQLRRKRRNRNRRRVSTKFESIRRQRNASLTTSGFRGCIEISNMTGDGQRKLCSRSALTVLFLSKATTRLI